MDHPHSPIPSGRGRTLFVLLGALLTFVYVAPPTFVWTTARIDFLLVRGGGEPVFETGQTELCMCNSAYYGNGYQLIEENHDPSSPTVTLRYDFEWPGCGWLLEDRTLPIRS